MLMWNWSGAAVEGKSNSYYGNTMMQLFMQHGAGPIITGSAINDGFDGVFDSLNVVYYPSIRKFTDILESQFYLELHRHKVLCDALVVLSTPLAN